MIPVVKKILKKSEYFLPKVKYKNITILKDKKKIFEYSLPIMYINDYSSTKEISAHYPVDGFPADVYRKSIPTWISFDGITVGHCKKPWVKHTCRS